MRILAIRGQNLASLAKPFSLELADGPLARSGLFAIAGPVGAGKTTLLDALCLALFDRTPRLSGRGGTAVGEPGEARGDWLRSNDPRTLLRRDAAEAFAEVDFTGRDGGRYRARWTVRRARRRADGRVQEQEMLLRDLDSDQVVASGRKTEVLAAIGERLGLDFAQFCRSVLLAQGEFAAFLRASPDERARLLENLTGAEIYRKLSRAAHARRKLAEADVARLGGQLDAAVQLDPAQRQALEARIEDLERDRKTAQVGVDLARGYLLWYETAAQQREEEGKAAAALQRALDAHDNAATARQQHDRMARAIAFAPRQELVAERQAAWIAGRSALVAAEQRAAAATARAQQLDRDVRAAVQRVLPSIDEPPPIVTEGAVWQAAWQRWLRLREQARLAAGQVGALMRAAAVGGQRATELQAALEVVDAAARAAEAALASARGAAEHAVFAGLPAQRQAASQVAAALRAEHERLRAWSDRDGARLAAAQELRLAQARERELAGDAPQLAAAVAAAHEALAAARADRERLRARTDAAALRHHLVAGEPCPLCGSREHPAPAHGDDGELRAAEARIAAAQQAADAAQRQQSERELRAQQAAQAVSAAHGAVERATQAAAAAQRAWQEVAPSPLHAEGLGVAAADLAVRERQKADAEATLRRLEAEFAAASAAYETARRDERDAVAVQRGRHAEVADALRAAREAQQAAQQAERERDRAAAAVDEAEGELAPAFAGQGDWVRAVDALGAGAGTTFARLASAWQQQRAAADEAAAAVAAVEVAGRDVARGEQEYAQAAAAFSAALAEAALQPSDVKAAVDLGEAAIRGEGERLRALEAEVGSARAVRKQCADVRRRHEETSSPTLAEADAAAALDEARAAQKHLEDQLLEAKGLARTDELLRRQREEIAPRLASAEAERDRWTAIDELIGSSTGDAFVVFAQGLTLDLLLAEANRRLAELARRYRLQKNEGEMDFVVVDLDLGGTRRSLQTLSGGETFLVSLALALALATLAAPRARVETLFLDEGFGTLDAQHLETALGALDALQAVGCQVGVISHVDGIAERIGAVVEVRPEGGGRSKVVTRLA